MRCRLFTILAVLSLVLCAGTCVEWVRSYWAREYVEWRRGTAWAAVGSSGQICLIYESPPDKNAKLAADESTNRGLHYNSSAPRPLLMGRSSSSFWSPPVINIQWDGFALLQEKMSAGPPVTAVVVPCWFLSVLLATLPSAWLWRWHKQRQRALMKGRCPSCGYDLRATPDRCPECGTVSKGKMSN
jgi:hypothetical protein